MKRLLCFLIGHKYSKRFFLKNMNIECEWCGKVIRRQVLPPASKNKKV